MVDCAEFYNTNISTVSAVVLLSKTNGNQRILINEKQKTISARYSDISNDEKIEREITILNHHLEVLQKDKHKRKNNKYNLPIHITTNNNCNSYRLNITFRNRKLFYSNTNLDNVIN